MKGLIGKKLGMTQIFDAKGLFVPVTVIQAGPCVVANIKSKTIDGYDAVVLGFEEIKESRLNKAEIGLFKKNKLKLMKNLKEFKLDNEGIKIGDVLTVNEFRAGDKVDVSGVTKGHGFSGTIYRWNAHRLKETHGTGPVVRGVGSQGANSTPSHVIKGKHMPGQYGNENNTILNLEVVKIDEAKNVILVKGSIPGAKGSLVAIKTTARK